MTNKLDVAQLVPGAVVMVGPSALPRGGFDHSWCDEIWRVEARTGDAVLCRRLSRLSGYADVIFMRVNERSWWAAEHVLDAYNKAIAETKTEYEEQRRESIEATERMRDAGRAAILNSTVS